MSEKITQLMTLANQLKIRHPELRVGQSIMNILADIDADLYREITGTDNDCFYVDDKVSKTINYVIKKWEK